MATQSKSTLKSYFNTGDQPTETQFANLIDSLSLIPTIIASPTAVTIFDDAAPDSSWHTADVSANVPATALLLLVNINISDSSMTGNYLFLNIRTSAGQPAAHATQVPSANENQFQMWVRPTNGTFQINVAGNPQTSTGIILTATPILYL